MMHDDDVTPSHEQCARVLDAVVHHHDGEPTC